MQDLPGAEGGAALRRLSPSASTLLAMAIST
jgi:hypothetical protein